ncbi:MAG: integrase [Methanobrevibacter arboriphilus]|nr:integrase [Methanobrevibacter arboriphilus]
MNIKKDIYFKKLITEKTLSNSTIKGYYYSLKQYSELHNMTLTELISEADIEEEKNIRMKRRKIKERLIKYQIHLKKQNYSKNYINGNITRVKSFYKYFEIERPELPPLNLKENYHERYSDIPTIKHIKQAIESTTNLSYKAMILFMATSGSSRMETHNLTVQNFIDGTIKYHKNGSIPKILDELEPQNDIIPLFQMVRQKTDYPYYTCCSPETSDMIIKHLKTLPKINKNDKIFNIDVDSISRFFNRLNIKNKWNKKPNGYNFFHPHALRKFNATVIEDIGFANTIQGRKSDPITEAYFKRNPERIREKYLEHLPKLTINKTIVNMVDSEVTKELREELKAKDNLIKDMNERLTRLEEADNRPIK